MLSHVKANVTELKEEFGRDAGSVVGPGYKQKASSWGAAIVMINSHNIRSHLFSQLTQNNNIAVAVCKSMEGVK